MTLRRYPDLPGSPLSVTTILKLAFPQPQLDAWKLREAVKLGRQFPDEPEEGILDRHRGGAMLRGSRIHAAIQATIEDEPRAALHHGPEQSTFNHWVAWWATRGLHSLGTELLVHVDATYAGTLDLLAIDEGQPHDQKLWEPRVVVDWKTCRKPR